MQNYLSLYGITHIKTGLYSPQANASERANREIISKIRFYLKGENHYTNWDNCIPHILTVLRGDYHTAINCPPYYAMFGQNMCSHGSTYRLLEKLDMLTEDTVVKRSDKLATIREKITYNLQKAHEKSSNVYNTRAKIITIQDGQEIFQRTTNWVIFRKHKTQNLILNTLNVEFENV